MKKISVLLLCLFFSFQINAQSASSTTFTTSSAGWFQVGKWTLGQRGSERVVISLNGGAYTPQKVVIDVFKDWSTGFLLDVKGARNSYIEQIRITKDDSYYYLDAYFDRVISQSNYLHLHNIEGKESGFVLNSGVLPVSTGSVFYETGDIQFKTVLNNTLDLRNKLLVSGNVGIGTSSPAAKLHIQNGGQALSFLRGSNTSGYTLDIGVNDDGVNFTNNSSVRGFNFRNSNGDLLKISHNGNAALNGKLETKEIKVTNTPTADFVFEESYNLPTLESIENHIKEKKHLPEIASAKEMKQNGVNVGNFQIQLLQKIEELTLYTIQQEKKIKEFKKENFKIERLEKEIRNLKKQNSKIERLEKENKDLKSLLERVSMLEKVVKNKLK
ncbi:hypothetical protein [Tenacibaculum discolor]|uniref:hypothetical protein n=1 Tax=Tenacibaculum discolor TaxID=361581 RepID=UPI003F7B1123